MPSRRRASRAPAFTLVELLVVIAIVVVLVALLLPVLNRVRGSALNVVCKNNLRQIGGGVAMYVNHNSGRFPHPAVLGGAPCRRLVGEVDSPGGRPEAYGWSALLDETGLLPADRVTGGVWVCSLNRPLFLDWKNTYVGWTFPRLAERSRFTGWQHRWLVWENDGWLAYRTGYPLVMAFSPDWRFNHGGPHHLPEEFQNYGPHVYRLDRTVPYDVPDGDGPFTPNGYTHVLHRDMSVGTYRHARRIHTPNSTLILDPQQVE